MAAGSKGCGPAAIFRNNPEIEMEIKTEMEMATNTEGGVVVDDWKTQLTEFLTAKSIEVDLTFGWIPQTVILPCRLMLTEDENNARLAFYSQPADAMKTGAHKYHCELISSVLSGRPQGLPYFDKFLKAGDYPKGLDGWKAALRDYLMLGNGDGKAEKIAFEAVDRYTRLTRPAEFFR